MFDRECVPFAPALVESMRSLGYSFSSAIADLIDNSVSAKARNIDIISEPGENPNLIILDDGTGMSKQELYEAMRYGSTNPLSERAVDDLGRFGLGLKSASLSQCRKLVVISKKEGKVSAFSWDLDYIIDTEKWMLKGFSEDEIACYPEINKLETLDHGTYIFLSEFDRIKEGTSNIEATFNKCLDDMVEHLSLVFHRYLEENLCIRVNNREVKAKDPFLSRNNATQRKKEIAICIEGQKILLKPYILPHISKLKQMDLDLVGGKEKLRNDQGFYVYRNKRLIV
ncbi:MAG: ATP-binding protein, partial [Oscillospiraceae bacterium]|nr:ATP-binding protein [Oscillospiraceae bacterium]